jgi:hypothetical protein
LKKFKNNWTLISLELGLQGLRLLNPKDIRERWNNYINPDIQKYLYPTSIFLKRHMDTSGRPKPDQVDQRSPVELVSIKHTNQGSKRKLNKKPIPPFNKKVQNSEEMHKKNRSSPSVDGPSENCRCESLI